MPDPAILMLIEHLNRVPPAIVQPAVMNLHGEMIGSYVDFAARFEAKIHGWITEGQRLQALLWNQMRDAQSGINRESLEQLIAISDARVRRDARAVRRFEVNSDRRDQNLTDAEWSRVNGAQIRILNAAGLYYREVLDVLTHLRAMRAELDEDSRGGPSFDNPDELSRYLAAQSADA